jgi:acyl-CoA thioester hydrolase
MPEDNPEYSAALEFKVRDYECDLQGIVNNANYLHYLEHARHEFLNSKGIFFADLHKEGTDLIIIKIEVEYKFPLSSRDIFVVKTGIRREGNIRLVFNQDIYRLPDEKHIIRARITGISSRKGRPISPAPLLDKLGLK